MINLTNKLRCKLAHKLAVSVILITPVLSGCASKVDEQNYRQSMEAFVAETNVAAHLASEDEINWWQQLHSAQLNKLVNDALASNYDLKTSQLQMKSALAKLGAQKAEYLPQGGVNLGAQRTGLADDVTRQSSANLGLNWQLDLFGRITALVDAANASAMSQAEQLRALRIEVVSAVVTGYISYQGNKQKEKILNLQITALEQSIDVLEARVQEGIASELDLNRTHAQLSQQQALLPDVSYAQYRDLSTLAMLTGRFSGDIILEDEQTILDTLFTVALAEPNKAIALRPDISRALYEFSQTNSLSVAASKALLPDVSLDAFVGIVSLGTNTLSNTQQQWQILPQIKWSLLSYPALLAQRDAQQYLSKAAYNEYQKVVLGALNDSELSLRLLSKSIAQKGYADQRYSFANKAFLQANAMYQEGQIPYLALLDARQDVLIAEDNAVNAKITSSLAKVKAYQAFNGRWSYGLKTL
ncbi:TolC family protein [Colwellia sp. 4_MG-2023]|uniref:TolC family protein n=1 Tax=unclassified Colwellia TaxID=196834 RepID=UPI0026E1DAC3|nr:MULTISPECIES: TolC family protein [unclassified Colwellia]MDO6507313.1 TolC family protein [Colwellia sp. 5_MG-2023]MDO6556046.1 TolC family protein [Colwellia sp. 4_MG-2023]